MNTQLITIGEAAKKLAVSIDTLRNWDAKGILKSFRPTPTSKRLYRVEDIENFINNSQKKEQNLFELAERWARNAEPIEIPKDYYCQTKDVFEARYYRLTNELGKIDKIKNLADIIVAITSEIGNNSYDHNLGNWPDIPGIFFAHDAGNRKIILADRGRGILKTLQRVRPNLKNHKDALYTAFTEIISGRAPEARGNGLKFVRSALKNLQISIRFQTGNAVLSIEGKNKEMKIEESNEAINGCFVIITY